MAVTLLPYSDSSETKLSIDRRLLYAVEHHELF